MIRDDMLIKSQAIVGMRVVDSKGRKAGVIREIFLDQRTGTIRFAALETGGLFGASGKFHPVPWRLLRIDDKGEEAVASFDRDRLKDAPSYDREQLNSPHYGWGAQTLRHFQTDGASLQRDLYEDDDLHEEEDART
jgi:sporulation protein YlmC with PRC-barrel domain